MLTIKKNTVNPLSPSQLSQQLHADAFWATSPLTLFEMEVASLAHKRSKVLRTERKEISREVTFEQPTPLSDLKPQAFVTCVKDTITFPMRAFDSASDVPLWQRIRNYSSYSNRSESLMGRYLSLKPQQDQMASMIEGALIFMYQLFRSRSPLDRAAAFAAYARSQGHYVADVGAFIVALDVAWAFLNPDEQLSDLQTQAFEFPTMPDFRSFLDQYEAFKNSKFYEKIYKFTMYALSFSLFKPVGVDFDYLNFDKVAIEAIKSKHHSGVDFVYTMLDTILFICERGYQCFQSRSILPMFHSELKYQDWYDRAAKLNRQALFLNNPDVHGIDRFAFLSELKDVIEQGQSMRRITPRKEDKQMLTKVLASLEMTHDLELTKRASQRDRIAPFCVLLYGGSSIGKTTLTNVLYQHYGKVRGLQTGPEYKYTRNPTEEYWSNFNSTQWCIQLDDIAFMSPRLGTMDPSLAEMLCVANNVPFVPAQAELHDKGRTPVRAELVIGSTNTECLNLPAYFSCPLAVQRRFPWVIDAKPKKMYEDPNRPGMLDSRRVPAIEEGEYPDYWTFVVKKVVPVDENRVHQMGRHETEAEFDNMRAFIKWYTTALLDHHTTQAKVMGCCDALRATKVCGKCHEPTSWCDCAPCLLCSQTDCTCLNTQAGEEDLIVDGIPNRETVPSYLIEPEHMTEPALEEPLIEPPEQAQNPLADLTTLQKCVIAYYMWWYILAYEVFGISFLLSWWYGECWFWTWAMRSRFRLTIVRMGLKYAGQRSYFKFQPPAHLAKAAAALVGVYATYKVAATAKNFFFGDSPRVQAFNETEKRAAGAMKHYSKFMEESEKVMEAATKEWAVPCTPADVIFLKQKFGEDNIDCFGRRVSDMEALETQARVIDPLAIGVTPEPVGGSKEVYQHAYADPMPLTKSDLSPAILCSKGSDPEILRSKIVKNTVVFDTVANGMRRTTSAVIMRGCVYMCNNHGIPEVDSFLLNVVGEGEGKIVANSRNILVSPSMIKRYPERDLAFIRLAQRPPGKDITAYFPLEGYNGKLDGTYLGRYPTGKHWRTKVCKLRLQTERWLSHGLVVEQKMWRGIAENPTDVGDCGMLLLSDTPIGQVILGMHTLGRGVECGAMVVPRDLVREACAHFEPVSMSAGTPTISAPSAQRWVSTLSPQSVVHVATAGTACVLGSYVASFRPRQTSNVARTLICESMLKRGYVVDKTAPKFNRTPWILALNDLSRPVTLLNSDILATAKADFLAGSKHLSVKKVQVYSVQTAVNGVAGLKYCDAINRKSSAGNPYKISKAAFLHPIESGPGEDLVMPNQEIMDTIADIIAVYESGDLWHPIFCGHLKDEPVSFEKAEAGKIRVFTASPFAWTVVVRMYLLSVIVHMQTHRFVYETGPGTVAQSLEWEEVREHITKHGDDRIVAGDYSKFDKRMPANVILAAFDIIIDICTRAGYSDKELMVVRGIAYDTAFPTVDFNGDLIAFFGSNPSGHPLTVIINGIANSLYMRYCYTVLAPPTETRPFKQNVALMTYGDDNIMGVSQNAPWFNHTAIVKVLGDIDIGYTMADKEAESVPYVSINGANFLKRTWRWDADIGAFVAPLDRSSINKMVTVCTLKGNITAAEHAVAVIETAVREYFWYGREEFETKTRMFQEVIKENNLELLVEASTFPTWQTLCDDFWAASEHVRLNRLN